MKTVDNRYALDRLANASICCYKRNAALFFYVTFSTSGESNQRAPLKEGEGFVLKNADEPHFFALQHPLPLKYPSHLSAEGRQPSLSKGQVLLLPKAWAQICFANMPWTREVFGASVEQNNSFCLQKYMQTKIR